jgi:hypothetical protein
MTGIDEPGPGDGDGQDPRLQAGLDHLQRAAREMIAASRALLDVAEELVEDPKTAAGILDVLGSVAGRGVGRAPVSTADADDDDDPPVQRIPVS